MEPTPAEEDLALVLPFVVTLTNGGPYDDDAFTAGWEAGWLDAKLESMAGFGGVVVFRTVREVLLPQLDLIAMRYNFVLTSTPVDGFDGWATASFTREPTLRGD